MKAVCPHLKIGATFALHDVQASEGGEANAAQEMADSPDLEDAPTENARCVWLPVTFSAEGVSQIKWYNRWKIEDFCLVLLYCTPSSGHGGFSVPRILDTA